LTKPSPKSVKKGRKGEEKRIRRKIRAHDHYTRAHSAPPKVGKENKMRKRENKMRKRENNEGKCWLN